MNTVEGCALKSPKAQEDFPPSIMPMLQGSQTKADNTTGSHACQPGSGVKGCGWEAWGPRRPGTNPAPERLAQWPASCPQHLCHVSQSQPSGDQLIAPPPHPKGQDLDAHSTNHTLWLSLGQGHREQRDRDP